ncbi:MAG: EamA family transporter [Acidobacteria bacterium]|nr:EamA family transporter [Acidobacteriota bacterium]MCL5287717.1 EamA family transporter [Acidobacteriota bacterium]
MPDRDFYASDYRWRLVAALAAVYVIWGSTYLAIRFAVQTLPPFLMAGARFVLSGAVLYAWARMRGAGKPDWLHWRSALIIGTLLLLGGNGGVVWAEQFVPSGLTALLVTSEPFWVVLLVWLMPGGHRPTGGVVFGMLLGLVGIILLVGPGNLLDGSGVHLGGAFVLFLASLSWAAGSLYSSKARLPDSAVLSTGMQMLAGGIVLTIFGTLMGDWSRLAWQSVSARSLFSLVYLIVFGSIIGFSSYYWLLRNTTPTRASTYAFVNPVVAVFLGWALAGEAITPRTLAATVIIVVAVMLVILRHAPPPGALQLEPLDAPAVSHAEGKSNANSGPSAAEWQGTPATLRDSEESSASGSL